MSIEAPSAKAATTLLKLQLGPVQEFIAQARSTRDLWSGSYLLSWLMAAGVAHLVKELAAALGVQETEARKQIISPNLSDQPLLDLHLEGSARAKPSASGPLNDERLTPNFTNILVAWLPDDPDQPEKCHELARGVVAAIRAEWNQIGAACWQHGKAIGLDGDEFRKRWNTQLASFPSIAWRITPGFASLPDATRAAARLPLKPDVLAVVQRASDSYATQSALNSWQLDAVRQLREFHAWGEGGRDRRHGLIHEKDSLTGREEAVLGGIAKGHADQDWWATYIEPKLETKDALWGWLFRKRQRNEHYGAITLVRRTWHWAYLWNRWKLETLHQREPASRGKEFPFPSTFHIASHDPAKNESGKDERLPEEQDSRQQRYFAVLAFDGDEMGKWLSGEKSEKPLIEDFHRDLSSRLGNFALHCTRPIVEACDGRLILAGGEDVLALLPADTAMDCAQFLRAAYRVEPQFAADLRRLAAQLVHRHEAQTPTRKQPMRGAEDSYDISPWLCKAALGQLFAPAAEGLLRHYALDGWVNHGHPTLPPHPGHEMDLRLPGGLRDAKGQKPEVSCGIAIAHFKEPLQDVVRAAQLAEKRAKNDLGRGALAVTLVKHSGETIEWGCKWDSGGLELLAEVQRAMTESILSAKFPHRVAELLRPYLVSQDGAVASVSEFDSNFDEIIRREFLHALDRQRGPRWSQDREESHTRRDRLEQSLMGFLQGRPDGRGGWHVRGLRGEDGEPLGAQAKLCAMIGLCSVAAFIEPMLHQLPVRSGKDSP